MVTTAEELPEEADTRRPPLEGQELRQVPNIGAYGALYSEEVVELYEDPDIITSRIAGTERHKVVLDIDFPAILLDSTTPGHHHLYIDREVSWEDYLLLITAMAKVGLLEDGYVKASIERGFTAVRLPWVRKSPHEAFERSLMCVGCRKHPDRIEEYDFMRDLQGCKTNAEFVRCNEGTLNRENGHFWCTACYIAAGQPLGVAP